MARKKRLEGREYIELIRLLPNAIKIEDYNDLVCLYLNIPYLRIANILDMKDAVLLATDKKAKMPDEWIEIMTTDEAERALWKAREFQKGL